MSKTFTKFHEMPVKINGTAITTVPTELSEDINNYASINHLNILNMIPYQQNNDLTGIFVLYEKIH